MMKQARIIGLLVIGLTLTACGFHLKGHTNAQPLSGMIIDVIAENRFGPLERLLRARLERSGAVIKADESARFQLHIDEQQLKRRALLRTETGRVGEYELTLMIKARIFKVPLTDPVNLNLSASREYVYDSTQLLASNEQEQSLIRDMRQDLSEQIIRQLTHAKNLQELSVAH